MNAGVKTWELGLWNERGEFRDLGVSSHGYQGAKHGHQSHLAVFPKEDGSQCPTESQS